MGTHEKRCYFEFGPFRLDPSERMLLRDGQAVPLTQKAFDTLFVLVENSGRVLEKDELLRTIWPNTFVEETTLAQNIFTLRRIMGETPDKNRYIETVPRRGYRFAAKVSQHRVEDTQQTMNLQIRPASALRSIAVLPFERLSPEGDDQYFGIGIADALITKLSNIRKIIVRPTSAVLKYHAFDQGQIAAGKELKVDFVLEGRILRCGDRVRVTAQLVNVDSGAPLWADQFDEKFTDIFTLLDKISERLVEALTLQLTIDERKLLAKHHTKNSEAYQYYLKGRYQWNRWTEEGFLKSIHCFRKVIELDPNDALAYAGLSDAFNALAYHGHVSPIEGMPQSKAAAEQALEIDQTLAEAHFSLASTLFFYDWDWRAAEREFRLAIELNPGYATAYQGYGLFLTAMGQFDRAIDVLQRALELDPVSLLINASMAFPYYYSNQYDQALAQCQKALDISEEFGLTRLLIGNVYVQKHSYDAAIAEYQKAMDLLGQSPDVLSSLGYVYAVSGETDSAVKIIDTLEELQNRYISRVAIAIVYAGLGEKDRAFEWLDKGYEVRSNKLVYLNVHPFFDTLRFDGRFTDLVKRIGLARRD